MPLSKSPNRAIRTMHRICTAWALFMLAFCATAALAETGSRIRYDIKTGIVDGSFSGATSGSFSLVASVDGEAEYLHSYTESIVAHLTMAVDPALGNVRYFFAGGGQRFYVFSLSHPLQAANQGDALSISTQRQYFFGWDAGFSMVNVINLSSSLGSNATLMEAGGYVGLAIPLYRQLKIQGSVGISQGIGVSSVAVNGTIIKGMLGVTF